MSKEIFIKNKITGERIVSPLPFEVAENDLPGYLTWSNANSIAETMGPGWRLPTYQELEMMKRYKVLLGMERRGYWTIDTDGSLAMSVGFKWYIPSKLAVKSSTLGVRLVKS